MLHTGSRDIGFGGADWVAELGVDVVEVLDTGLDPVRIVAAAPNPKILEPEAETPGGRKLIIASEYEQITRNWMKRRGIDVCDDSRCNFLTCTPRCACVSWYAHYFNSFRPRFFARTARLKAYHLKMQI